MSEGQKKIVLIGAGKIGKGYVADLFEKAGYQLVLLTRSLRQAKALREQGYYTLFKYFDDESEPVARKISDFEAYSTEEEYEASVVALVDANYATLHLYPGAFEAVGKMIGDVIKERVRQGKKDTLDIMLLLNFVDPDTIIREHIESRLETPEEWEDYNERIGLVKALTFRWGGNPRPFMLEEDALCACAADSPDIPVDAEAFKGEIPTDVPLRPLTKMRERLAYKVWGGNVNHYILSVIGYVKGYTYTFEAEEDEYVVKCATLGTQEARFGYDQVFTLTEAEKEENNRGRQRRGVRPQKREEGAEKKAPVRYDEVTRVAADPIRKLARNDRLIGPALGCIKAGRVPYFLTLAAAYAFIYAPPEDQEAMEIQAYLAENSIEQAVEHFCQLDLTKPEENQIYQLVLTQYYNLVDIDPYEISY